MNVNNGLEFVGISKYFPGVKALDNVSFKANPGEVLALLGENGAGKSTLLKILNGDYQPNKGKYILGQQERHFHSPRQAIEAGVSVIYQERQILLELSVTENIYLGRMPVNRFGIIDEDKANAMAQEIIDDFGLDISPTTKVKDLSIAIQQMVEIMKAYSRKDLKVICFDEPTASLSDKEIDSLFDIINKLRDEGKTILYVSHRMNEIRRIADTAVILKDGQFVKEVGMNNVSDEEIIRLMVGRNLDDVYSHLDRNNEIGDVILEVDNVSSDYVFENSFKLHRGEILGFSGLVGAGRTELMRAIIGADKLKSGKVILEGKEIRNASPYQAMKNGIVLIPEDRKSQGIISNLDVQDNINISLLDKHSNFLGVVDTKEEKEVASWAIDSFNIRTPSAHKNIVELSGGNQQKCIVARWAATEPKILILDEPTKGIDVGAKSEFYQMINEFAKRGLGIILISSELPEIIGLSDRIIVMKGLRITGEVSRSEASEDKLLTLAMIGAKTNEIEEQAIVS